MGSLWCWFSYCLVIYVLLCWNSLYQSWVAYALTQNWWSCCLSPYMCRSKELIIKAIDDNDFLRNLDSVQINEIVDCMYQREFTNEQYICREGSVGTELYVISGTFVCVCVCGLVSMYGSMRLAKNNLEIYWQTSRISGSLVSIQMNKKVQLYTIL